MKRPLPSEAQLMRSHGVARGAIRRVLKVLEAEGALEPVPGISWPVAQGGDRHSLAEWMADLIAEKSLAIGDTCRLRRSSASASVYRARPCIVCLPRWRGPACSPPSQQGAHSTRPLGFPRPAVRVARVSVGPYWPDEINPGVITTVLIEWACLLAEISQNRCRADGHPMELPGIRGSTSVNRE
ncbi:protein of unknown function [Streptomyces sp. KY75]|nr:protein of unknown function [Streptomyces sp. KY75]CAD5988211.1 protein of unknown function [Streptomyces sp. KY70]